MYLPLLTSKAMEHIKPGISWEAIVKPLSSLETNVFGCWVNDGVNISEGIKLFDISNFAFRCSKSSPVLVIVFETLAFVDVIMGLSLGSG